MAEDADLILYHMVPSRSAIVLWMLEEVGQPYHLRLLDREAGENRRPGYLAINPMGKVPALTHRGVVITEAAAICCYLADAFPEAGLAPPVGDPRRGPYLKWLFFGPSCFEPAVTDHAFERPAVPVSTVGWGSYETVVEVMAAAVAAGPFLLGEAFSAADVVIGSGIRWGRSFNAVPERPEFLAYAAHLEARPALQRAEARDAALSGEAKQ